MILFQHVAGRVFYSENERKRWNWDTRVRRRCGETFLWISSRMAMRDVSAQAIAYFHFIYQYRGDNLFLCVYYMVNILERREKFYCGWKTKKMKYWMYVVLSVCAQGQEPLKETLNYNALKFLGYSPPNFLVAVSFNDQFIHDDISSRIFFIITKYTSWQSLRDTKIQKLV